MTGGSGKELDDITVNISFYQDSNRYKEMQRFEVLYENFEIAMIVQEKYDEKEWDENFIFIVFSNVDAEEQPVKIMKVSRIL